MFGKNLFHIIVSIALFSACTLSVLGEEEERISFVTTVGESIENAKIMRVEPDGVSFMHSRGITKIPLEQLPDELKSRFGLNSGTAARYRAAQAAAMRARAEQARILREQQLQEEQRYAEDKENARKRQANYVWHIRSRQFTGRLLLLDGNNVLLQEQNHTGRFGLYMFSLLDLPPSERELAKWIAKGQTQAERKVGELALYNYEKKEAHLRYVVAKQADKEARERAKIAANQAAAQSRAQFEADAAQRRQKQQVEDMQREIDSLKFRVNWAGLP